MVTSTLQIADFVRQIAGNRVQVVSVLATGVDPHRYQPTPQDVELLDFVKSVFAMFGIISQVDNISNELVLHRFEELGDNKASSLDLSDKIDFEQKFKLDYHATDYAQENFFKVVCRCRIF